ncbi:MAG: DUF402 domain-containing protein [Spirochaetales bacterium]|nr:DUF402 domain-containing protein [Spirochaetales bacterium]
MELKSITIRSRLGEFTGQTDGQVAFFNRDDVKTGKMVRHFVLLGKGVKLMYEPWGWEHEWYADIISIDQIQDDIIELRDLLVDIIIEGDGPTYRVIDLDDLADAVENGSISPNDHGDCLRKLQRFLDKHLHAGKDFPPKIIEPYMPER